MIATTITTATTPIKSVVGILLALLSLVGFGPTPPEAVLNKAWSTRWTSEPVEPLKDVENRVK